MIEPIDVLEALLFASDAPVEPTLIRDVLELPSPDAARELIDALRRRFEEQGRVLQVIEAGGGFRLVTRPEIAPWLIKLARSKTRARLSRPALETLAIVAYRQPVSRPEVDATRGVNSEGVLDNLLERRLIRIGGRKESPGRPFLYETTREFLVAFGLRDLGDLPKVDGELAIIDPTADAAVAAAADLEDPAEDGSAPAGEPALDAMDAPLATAALSPAAVEAIDDEIGVGATSSDALPGTADAPETPAPPATATGESTGEGGAGDTHAAIGALDDGEPQTSTPVTTPAAGDGSAADTASAPPAPDVSADCAVAVGTVEKGEHGPAGTAPSVGEPSSAADPPHEDSRASGTDVAPRR